MQCSIITPSFRSSRWLRLCLPSVADQCAPHEHIVQDAGSDDGTLDWLPRDPRVRAYVEKDRGMYDAVNRGYRRAAGEILSYLNCDEQYLPGALDKVRGYFQAHPEVDVLFGDCLVVNADGSYRCERRQRPDPTGCGGVEFATFARGIGAQVHVVAGFREDAQELRQQAGFQSGSNQA